MLVAGITALVVLGLAAPRMRRLQAYPLAIVASILAMIILPGNVIGLPIGIWALIVLSRPEVRAAFGRAGSSHRDGKQTRTHGVHSVALGHPDRGAGRERAAE